MSLPSAYLDHYRNPRGAGRLPAPTVSVAVENPVCGDQLSLDLVVAEGRIDALGYAVRGCSASVAAASALHELAQGAPLAAARELDRDALDAALGGLPTLKRHGADLAAAALRRALADLGAAAASLPGSTPREHL